MPIPRMTEALPQAQSQPVHADMLRARAILKSVYGYDSFRPGQAEVLEAIFNGEDVMAVMPTGSGKSILYQLPALVRLGLTIVVSPLIALMRDQVRQLQNNKIAAGALNSANEYSENLRVEDAIRTGKLRLVYVAPERLVREDTLRLLREAKASVLAIDEAHCVSQWGHDFRPEYLALGEIARALGGIQTLAVTATADEPTRTEIARKLFVRPPHIFVQSFDRPNLRLAMMPKKNAARQIADALDVHKGSNGIIYCASRKRCEAFAESLTDLGHDALPYHAGLPPDTRSANQDRFLREDGIIICATIAFGMGIDKPDVRFVFHADLPQSIEAYYQEIGRAGRDGLPADTLLLFGMGDVSLRRRQISENDAPQERKRAEYKRLDALVSLCETARCRRVSLLAAFGESARPCGNCDNCTSKVRVIDGVVAAQKVMSAVLRTAGRFFAGHIADILTGRETDLVAQHGHDKLPTFGVGRDRSLEEWRTVFRQISAAGLIVQDMEQNGRWIVTDEGRRVLKGEAALELRADEPAPRGTERAARKEELKRAMNARDVDKDVLAALKALRLELARVQNLPAYVIFPDRSLLEMATRQPRTRTELSRIHGVGEAKLEKYADVFLAVLNGRVPPDR